MHDGPEKLLPPGDCSKEILNRIEDNVIVLKMKMASILQRDLEKKQLAYLDVFQFRFLKIDGEIALIRHEMNELEEKIKEGNSAGIPLSEMEGLLDIMASRIDIIVFNFAVIDIDFKIFIALNNWET